MTSTSSNRYRTPRSAELTAWLAETAGNNSEQLLLMRRKLRTACRQELTPRQREVVELYFFSGKKTTLTRVANQLGVDRSTVSRTLKRAMRRLRNHLRYAW